MAAIMELDRIDAIPPAIQVPTKDEISQAPPTHESQPEIDDGSSASPVTPRRSKTQLTVIMSMLFFSIFLAAIDTTITVTALPTISAHFNSSTGYTWVGSAYLLATAASGPTWGALSNIWGRKPALLGALVVFFLGSLLAGVSPNMSMLIAGRAVQGTGGGGILILSNICTADLFSMRTRGLVYGLESLVWATAAGVGPILGGVFAEDVGWRWCFYIGMPCSGLAFLVLMIFLDMESPSTPAYAGLLAIDWIGSITIVGATTALLLGLEFGGVIFPWSSVKVICLIVFGVVIAGCFLFNEARFAQYPVVPLRLFKHWPNIAALAVAFLHGLTYFAASYYLPLYGQAVRGYSPLKSGLFLIPFEFSLSASSALSGILTRVTGRYLETAYIGLTMMVLGFGLFIRLDASSSRMETVLLQVVAGMGTGLSYIGPLLSLQARSATKDSAAATATLGFVRNLAMAISVVIGGVVIQNGMEVQSTMLRRELGDTLASKLGGKVAAANVVALQNMVMDDRQRQIVESAYASALKRTWILFTCTAAAALCVSFFLKKKSLCRDHENVVVGLGLGQVEREPNQTEQGKRRSERPA